jgi:hypothetical protein
MSEIPTATVEVAASVLRGDYRKAREVLAAAAPLIRQATADEIAAEIEALMPGIPDDPLIAGMRQAAGIARRVGGGGGGGGGQ